MPRGDEALLHPPGGFPFHADSTVAGPASPHASGDGQSPTPIAAGAPPAADPAANGGGGVGVGAAADLNGSHAGGEECAAALHKLFDFKCGLTRGRPISSMAWNCANSDVLAIAYGEATPNANANANAALSRGGGLSPGAPAPSAPGTQPNTAFPSGGGGGGVTLAQQLAAGGSVGTASSSAPRGPGPSSLAASRGGLVLFWSLRNPQVNLRGWVSTLIPPIPPEAPPYPL